MSTAMTARSGARNDEAHRGQDGVEAALDHAGLRTRCCSTMRRTARITSHTSASLMRG